MKKIVLMTNNIPDIEFADTITISNKVLHRREFKDASGPSFTFNIDATVANGQEKINTTNVDKKASFIQNLKYWNNQSQFLASNDFKNSYYRSIVGMGVDAIPLILEEIKVRPSFLVHALDEILPGIVEYGEGYIPIEEACKIWISILAPIEEN